MPLGRAAINRRFLTISHSPFTSVRALVVKKNARLNAECGANCTKAVFDRIDAQMQLLDRAAQLAELQRRGGISTAQAIQLGETLAALLPLYGLQ